MAFKDWELIKKKRLDTTVWVRKNQDNISFKDKKYVIVSRVGNTTNWYVNIRMENYRGIDKEFKTKLEAMKYARLYMSKH